MTQYETVDSQPARMDKVRLTDEQMETLEDALRIAQVAMRSAAELAETLGDPFLAQQCLGRAERFSQMLVDGAGVTRITVRF